MTIVTIKQIEAFKQGGSKAFKIIFNIYWEKLFTAAYYRVKNYEQAQDIVQEVFIKLWNRRADLNLQAENIEYYLLKAVKHGVISYYRTSKIKESVLEDSLVDFNEEYEDVPTLQLEVVENFVKAQVEELPEKMRIAYQMRDNDISIKDIANHLDVAEQTVKNHLYEAKSKLRTAVKTKFLHNQMALLFIIILLLTKN